MTAMNTAPVMLTVEQVADRLNTKPRFVRRLIAERRIEFHKLGRYVRISEPDLAAFIKAGRVEAVGRSRRVTGQVLWSTACAQTRQRRTRMRTPLLGERA
jgi:excisionase family DNA binding protein